MILIPARATLPAAILAASVLAAAPQAFSQTRTVDMRDCPLDTVTFIDPWGGGAFRVERVGTNYVYLCGSEVRDEPAGGDECMGPYGDLILKGSLQKPEYDRARPLFAIWSVSKALPCCGWTVSVDKEERVLVGLENFRWLAGKDVPKLGELPFASIYRDEVISNFDFEAMFGSPKIAMACELPRE